MKETFKFLKLQLLFIVVITMLTPVVLLAVDLEESRTESVVPSSAIEQTMATAVAAENSNEGNVLFYIAIVVLALTTLLSIGISFYLYRWRKVLVENNHFVVPEEWAKCLQDLSVNFLELRQVIGGELQVVGTESKSNTEKVTAMTETYMELQNVLDEKDKEIKRLRKGYDAEIFKRFVRRFARIEQSIDDFIFEDGESDQLMMLRRLFEDAFDECGICKFSPETGEDYRRANGVSDNPKFKITENTEDEFKICEILEAGYKLNAGVDEEVILPAKVKIFKLK